MDKNSYLIDLSESDRTDFGTVDFSAQVLEQQVFSAIYALESRVNSGGFSSFLEDEEPELVAFTPIALRTVGAASCSDIVNRAIALASSNDLAKIDEQLGDLDSEFYDYPDDLTDLLYKYVSAHQDTFGKALGGP